MTEVDMSLLADIKKYYEKDSLPPTGSDLDYVLLDGQWVKGDTETVRVSYEVIDDSPRWGNVFQIVYRRGEEFVAVEDVEPATEDQDWGDYGDPEIFEVNPVEVTVTKYERVNK